MLPFCTFQHLWPWGGAYHRVYIPVGFRVQHCVLPFHHHHIEELCAFLGPQRLNFIAIWVTSKRLYSNLVLKWKTCVRRRAWKRQQGITFDIREASISCRKNTSTFSCKEATHRSNCFTALLLRLWCCDQLCWNSPGGMWALQDQRLSPRPVLYLLFNKILRWFVWTWKFEKHSFIGLKKGRYPQVDKAELSFITKVKGLSICARQKSFQKDVSGSKENMRDNKGVYHQFTRKLREHCCVEKHGHRWPKSDSGELNWMWTSFTEHFDQFISLFSCLDTCKSDTW